MALEGRSNGLPGGAHTKAPVPACRGCGDATGASSPASIRRRQTAHVPWSKSAVGMRHANQTLTFPFAPPPPSNHWRPDAHSFFLFPSTFSER